MRSSGEERKGDMKRRERRRVTGKKRHKLVLQSIGEVERVFGKRSKRKAKILKKDASMPPNVREISPKREESLENLREGGKTPKETNRGGGSYCLSGGKKRKHVRKEKKLSVKKNL